MEFVPTPFWDLVRDKNQWLIFRGRTYLIEIGAANKNAPQLVLNGLGCSLEECESLDFLERRYMHQQLPSGLHRNVGINQGEYWDCISRIVETELSSRYGISGYEDRMNLCEFRDPVTMLKPVMNRILNRPLTLENRVCLEWKYVQKDEGMDNDSSLNFRGRWYIPHTIINATSLELKLRKSMAKKMVELTRHKDNNSGMDGKVLTHTISPFIVRKRGRHYLFPEAELRLSVQCAKDMVYLSGPAEVVPPYIHPFVYPNGKICYGSDKRFHRIGIRFTEGYPLDDVSTLGKIIAALFDEAGKNLRSGYLKAVEPVNRLNTPLFERYLCTEEQAQKSGLIIYRQ